jgi:hypothetical protein
MANIYIKIHKWQADSKSITFSCASDGTRSQNPDDYEILSVQPFEAITNLNSTSDFLKYLAKIAKYTCDYRIRQESDANNLEMVSRLQTLEGQSFTFDINDIINDAFENVDMVQEV